MSVDGLGYKGDGLIAILAVSIDHRQHSLERRLEVGVKSLQPFFFRLLGQLSINHGHPTGAPLRLRFSSLEIQVYQRQSTTLVLGMDTNVAYRQALSTQSTCDGLRDGLDFDVLGGR
jgi:hypothetical protein